MSLSLDRSLRCAVQHGHIERRSRRLKFHFGRENCDNPAGSVGSDDLVKSLRHGIELLLELLLVDLLLFRARLLDNLSNRFISSSAIDRTFEDSSNDA